VISLESNLLTINNRRAIVFSQHQIKGIGH
jgi:hypothetical protein